MQQYSSEAEWTLGAGPAFGLTDGVNSVVLEDRMPRLAKFHDAQFLDAARRVVSRQGPSGATISAIAQAIGAPTGSLYHRFPSRDVLLGEVCRTGSGESPRSANAPPLSAGRLHRPRLAEGDGAARRTARRAEPARASGLHTAANRPKRSASGPHARVCPSGSTPRGGPAPYRRE